jgi:hypothetical protein
MFRFNCDSYSTEVGWWGKTKLLRVLQVKKCSIVIASEAKQSQGLGLLRFARNDGFWIIYFLEHS